jgi:hypothetical protein
MMGLSLWARGVWLNWLIETVEEVLRHTRVKEFVRHTREASNVIAIKRGGNTAGRF